MSIDDSLNRSVYWKIGSLPGFLEEIGSFHQVNFGPVAEQFYTTCQQDNLVEMEISTNCYQSLYTTTSTERTGHGLDQQFQTIVYNNGDTNCIESPLFVQHTSPIEPDPGADPYHFTFVSEDIFNEVQSSKAKDYVVKEQTTEAISDTAFYEGGFEHLPFQNDSENQENDINIDFNHHVDKYCQNSQEEKKVYIYRNISDVPVPGIPAQYINDHNKTITHEDSTVAEHEFASTKLETNVNEATFQGSSVCDILSLSASDDTKQLLHSHLSNLPYFALSDIQSNTALLKWSPPDCGVKQLNDSEKKVDFTYKVQLRKGNTEEYRNLFTGRSLHLHINGLRSCTNYHVRLYVLYDTIIGDPIEISFCTKASEPEKPEFPKLLNKTATSLNLKWKAPKNNGGNILHYVLECDGLSKNPGYEIIYKGTASTFNVTRLQSGRTYTFRLFAVNDIGCSKPSSAGTYQTRDILAPPETPKATSITKSTVDINWQKRSFDTKFLLLINHDTSGCFYPVYEGEQTQYTCTNLKPKTTYRFQLQSINKEGKSLSDQVSVETLSEGPSPPLPPTLIGVPSSESFQVGWKMPVTGQTYQEMSYKLEILVDGKWIEIYSGSNVEYSCKNLSPGIEYLLRVACITNLGASEYSAIAIIKTLPSPPSKCLSLKIAGKPNLDSLQLEWSSPKCNGGMDIINYDVVLQFEDDSTQFVSHDLEMFCIFTGLLPGRTYRFKVRANNAVGNGPWSDHLLFKTKTCVPDIPEKPKVLYFNSTTAHINWESPNDNGAAIKQFSLQMSTAEKKSKKYSATKSSYKDCSGNVRDNNSDYSTIYSGNNFYYEALNLLPATTYAFRIAAMNVKGASKWSNETIVRTKSAPPSAPLELLCTAATNSIYLQWKEPPNNGEEILHYNIKNEGFGLFSTLQNERNYTIDGLQPGTQYTLQVQAANKEGPGSFSIPVISCTLPLPPNPPKCECIHATANSLKLKWSNVLTSNSNGDVHDGSPMKYLNCPSYTLEIENARKKFQVVYCGKNRTFKIGKLLENHEYRFRVLAANESGKGPYSNVYTFKTNYILPQTPKAGPRVSDVNETGCKLSWRPIKKDTIPGKMYYHILIKKDTVDGSTVFEKEVEKTDIFIEELEENTHYSVHVKGLFHLPEGGELCGHFSPPSKFTTKMYSARSSSNSSLNDSTESDTLSGCNISIEDSAEEVLSDTFKAFLRMLILMILAALFAGTIDV